MIKLNLAQWRFFGLLTVAIVGLVLLLMLMQGSFESKVAPGQIKFTESAINEPTAVVETRVVNDWFSWAGTVRSRSVGQIAAKMNGRILQLSVKVGDHLQAGQLLAKLEDQSLRAEENQALAALTEANTQAQHAQQDYQRTSRLFAQQAATRENLDAVDAQNKIAQALVKQATSRLVEIRSHVADTALYAPFAAVVVEKFKEIGDTVMAGQPLFAVQTHENLRLEVSVPSQCAARLQLGNEVKVRIDTLAISSVGRIDELSPEIDPQTRNQLIKIQLPKLNGLQAGYLGWMDQICQQHTALLIPKTAVIHLGQLEAVKVLQQGQIQLRHIRTAKNIGDQVEVISGLRAGETVLVSAAAQS